MSDEIRTMPYNTEAEDSILACVLVDGHSAYERASLYIKTHNAFYNGDSQLVWRAMTELFKEREAIDMITTLHKCRDLDSKRPDLGYYLSGLAVPTTANIESYSKIVWQKYIQRETGNSAYKLYTMSYDDFDKSKSFIEEHRKLIDELRTLHPSEESTVENILNEAIDSIKSGRNIIPFGIKALDSPASGMTRKELTVLGGRPGHGKTTLIINIVRSLLEQGYKVMLFNREMSNIEMMKKMMIMEYDKIDYSVIRKGDLNGHTEIYKYSLDTIPKKYNNLKMYDNVRTLTDSMIEISRYKPDVVIDDYIQLISVDKRKERRFQLEEVMQEYKWICKKENCSGILVSQLNRNLETRADPRPRMSDYSESGVIEQTAETAMFVFYGHNFDDTQYDKYESMIISAKTRYGRVGSFVVGFNGDRCKFYDTPDDARGQETLFES